MGPPEEREPEGLFDRHDMAVAHAVDEAVAALEAGEIAHALRDIERAVGVSETHPTFAKRASSEFHRLEGLARICVNLLSAAHESNEHAKAILKRIRSLKRATIH